MSALYLYRRFSAVGQVIVNNYGVADVLGSCPRSGEVRWKRVLQKAFSVWQGLNSLSDVLVAIADTSKLW